MTAVEASISMNFPLFGVTSLQAKWHRSDWHFRLVVLALAAAASENEDFIDRVSVLVPAMNSTRLEKPMRD